MTENPLTHFNAEGRARMVDVGEKTPTARRALAAGALLLGPAVYEQLKAETLGKGDPIPVAELAGVMGAKRTSDLIPLCHPLPLSKVEVRVQLHESEPRLDITAEARTTGTTGVEMEALTAVSVAALTLYDMMKAADKGMIITEIKLLEKDGGKSGPWRLEE